MGDFDASVGVVGLPEDEEDMITDSRRVCENSLKRENMKEEDVKTMGQKLGQVLNNQFSSGEGSSLTQGVWDVACFLVTG